MADIVSGIPVPLSGFSAGVFGGAFIESDVQYDYALGGIPFMSATRDQFPHIEQMIPIRKQQFDNQTEPGEQSLADWWFRSQSSFTGGAGLLYQDPDADNQFGFKFADSLGVNPWVSGALSLLRESDDRATLSTSSNFARGYVDPALVDSAWYTDGNTLTKITSSGTTVIATASIATTLGLSASGARYLRLRTDGIWSAVDTAVEVQMYSPPAGVITSGTIEFAKDRIAVAFNNAIYFAPIVTTGLPAALPAAAYTHSDPNWVWTSITEGPTAIYAAGTNGTTSSVFKFVFDLATLTAVTSVTATLPLGEQINTIYGYLGTFMGMATSKGFRVAEFTGDGDIVYGPLLFEVTDGCHSIVGFDRFLWTGTTSQHDGSSGLFRVDLGASVQEQTTRAVRYAYARDIYGPGDTARVTAVTSLGASNRRVYLTQMQSVWTENASNLVPEGYLRTGRIRFNTEEPKLFKFVSLRSPIPLQGEMLFSILNQNGGETPYITYGPEFAPGGRDIATPVPAGPQVWIALKFTLRRGDSDPTVGAVLNGWQVKALPGSIRQRMITTTFLLFDNESDRGGQRVGYEGYARDRLDTFRDIMRVGDVVLFQELQEHLSTQVVIDDYQYQQFGPPAPNSNVLGGYLTVKLRTVAETT